MHWPVWAIHRGLWWSRQPLSQAGKWHRATKSACLGHTACEWRCVLLPTGAAGLGTQVRGRHSVPVCPYPPSQPCAGWSRWGPHITGGAMTLGLCGWGQGQGQL